jgi:GTP-binding protein YchF
MKAAIVGLRHSGKTTLFNALTGGVAEVGSYSSALKPNIGVRKVGDPRLQVLAQLTHSARIVPAEVNLSDVNYVPRESQESGGISTEVLGYLSTAEALLQVIRCFEDPSVPHPLGSVDPVRDIGSFDLELTFSDLGVLERRLIRLKDKLKSAKATERAAQQAELALLERIKGELEHDVPIRSQSLTPDEQKMLSGYQFLTAKPMLLVANIGEAQLSRASEIEQELASHCPGFTVLAVCAKLEMELLELSAEEAQEYRHALGATAGATERLVSESLQLLGLVSFLTTGPDETRAWTVQRGTPAPQAAGKVHSDIEKGFIRAEVITYDDFVSCGTEHEARKRGVLRLEGKDYIVQDGDVVNFLFNL